MAWVLLYLACFRPALESFIHRMNIHKGTPIRFGRVFGPYQAQPGNQEMQRAQNASSQQPGAPQPGVLQIQAGHNAGFYITTLGDEFTRQTVLQHRNAGRQVTAEEVEDDLVAKKEDPAILQPARHRLPTPED